MRRATHVRRRIPWSWVLRALVSGLVLALVFVLLPAEQIWLAVRDVPLWLWITVVVLFLAGHVVAAIKWSIVALRGRGVTLGAAIRAHFAGLAANLCLPGIAGGDVVRASLVIRSREHGAPIALGSLVDRLLDSLALLLLACLGVLLSLEHAAGTVAPLLSVGLVLLAGLLALPILALLLPRLPSNRVTKLLAEATAAILAQPLRLVACLGLSLMVQAGFVGLNILLAKAAGLEVPAAGWLFAWPLSKLIAVIPISLGGLGVREASLAALMAPYGGSAAKVVAVGLLWQTVLIAGGLIGALSLALVSRRRSITDGPDGEVGPSMAGAGAQGQPRPPQPQAESR